MIKISRECAKSLEHLITNDNFKKQVTEMFELNPLLIDLIDAIYTRIISGVLKNEPKISKKSLIEIKSGIGLGVASLYQLIRIQMESNDLETNS